MTEPDTRYLEGVIQLYAGLAAHHHGGRAEDYQERARAFVQKHLEWHEARRYRFQAHPDWEEIVAQDGIRGIG